LPAQFYAGQVRFLGPDLASEVVTFDLVMFTLVGGIGTCSGRWSAPSW
jgi:branched-chain amino acid transport system permease protein